MTEVCSIIIPLPERGRGVLRDRQRCVRYLFPWGQTDRGVFDNYSPSREREVGERQTEECSIIIPLPERGWGRQTEECSIIIPLPQRERGGGGGREDKQTEECSTVIPLLERERGGGGEQTDRGVFDNYSPSREREGGEDKQTEECSIIIPFQREKTGGGGGGGVGDRQRCVR